MSLPSTLPSIIVTLALLFQGLSCSAKDPISGPLTEQALGTLDNFLGEYCVDCHNDDDPESGISLQDFSFDHLQQQAPDLERVVRKLVSRQMPPADMPRPTDAEFDQAITAIASRLDQHEQQHPNPGRTETLRRLNRTEYGNAVRDLVSLQLDVKTLLPKDEESHGFDNVTVSDLPPVLLNRYVSAAQKISRLAVGGTSGAPIADTFRIKPDVTQEQHVPGLPFGTRGGAVIHYNFPATGQYEIVIRLTRDRNEHVEGLSRPHQLEVLLDRTSAHSFTVKPPRNKNHSNVDAHLNARIEVEAGPHDVGVTFIQDGDSLIETMRQPLESHFNTHRHPRQTPAIYEVSITGPFSSEGPGDTPSRDRIFAAYPASADEHEQCARQNLMQLAKRAYRRPIVQSDIEKLLAFYRQARQSGESFEAGMQAALSAILVSPHFLLRIETPPEPSGDPVYQVPPIELASRLSFFLWSSIPDDELLDLAISGKLAKPAVLDRQVRRMLADPKADNLATNFADQWLYLRNLESFTPDGRLFPDFDDNLRQAMRKETQLHFRRMHREDRSVLDLLHSDSTFLNQRLAKHYGIPHIFGGHFREVKLPSDSRRGGLLRHASILTVTSYATRTSPVIRGNWILKNLLGAPPPPPPPNVPALEDNTVSADLPLRARLAEHRDNAACASCHRTIDPVGFSLENYDAIGRWREREGNADVDASGGLPDGSQFIGVDGLEDALLARPELFVSTLTEKLMTFALGRGIEYYDGPAIRKIVRQAREEDYCFSSIVVAIVHSTPFQMRRAPNDVH